MFEQLDIFQKHLVFHALKQMIESADGVGFHNFDQGHLCYISGAEGETDDFSKVDGPEKNNMYKMLSELSRDFKANNATEYVCCWHDFSEWQDFCKFANDAHRKVKVRGRYNKSMDEKVGEWKECYERLQSYSDVLVKQVRRSRKEIEKALDPNSKLLEGLSSHVSMALLAYRQVEKKFEEVEGAFYDVEKAISKAGV